MKLLKFRISSGSSLWGVVLNVMDWNAVVSEFELVSRYNVYFRTNTLGKRMDPFIFQVLG